MPLAGVSAASKDYQAKKAAAESGGVLYLSIEDGDEVTIRPLEEGNDFVTYYVHRLPQQGNRFPTVPCPDPGPAPSGRFPCKGCEDGHKRSFKFALNVIHRNAPVPERDENNRVRKDSNNKIIWARNGDGTTQVEDQVKVWNGGINVAEDLDHLDGKFGGLTSRDFDVARRGVKLNTTYTILPAGDRSPLTPKDQELATKKYDLNELKKAPEYELFYAYRSGGGGANGNNSAGGNGGVDSPTQQSPFVRRNRTEDSN